MNVSYYRKPRPKLRIYCTILIAVIRGTLMDCLLIPLPSHDIELFESLGNDKNNSVPLYFDDE